MGATRITGVDKLIGKLTGELKRKKAAAFSRVIRECGADLIAESLEMVPVHQGILRASGDVRVEGTGFNTVVHAGYTDEKAVMIHEILPPTVTHGAEFNAKHAGKILRIRKARKKAGLKGKDKYWFNRKPKESAKFLERPFRDNRDLYIKHIKEELAK